jgi:hypothetical protein
VADVTLFDPARDVEPLHTWLRATSLAGEWCRCRSLAGQATDDGLLAAIRHEHPKLIADPATIDRRSTLLPDYEPGSILVRDPAKPTSAELTRVRLIGINLIRATLRGDYGSVFQLSPKTTEDGAYMATALAEVDGELITATGRDPVEVVSELRGEAIRNQATGGRP